MKCSYCGSELKESDSFCGICGTKVTNSSEEKDNLLYGNEGSEVNTNPIVDEYDENKPKSGFVKKINLKKENDLNHTSYRTENPSEENDSYIQRTKKNNMIIVMILSGVILVGGITSILTVTLKSQEKKKNDTEAAVVQTAVAESTNIPEENDAVKLDTYFIVNCEKAVSLREESLTTAKVLKDIPYGAAVSYVEAAQNGFAKIIYNGITGYALQSYLSDIKPEPKKTEEPKKEDEKNTASVHPGSGTMPVNRNVSYEIYNSYEYNFVCCYPSDFYEVSDESNFVLYAAEAYDESALLKICATRNENGRTPSIVRDNFKSSYPGTVELSNSGDDWCVIRTVSNGKKHYGYFKLINGMIRGFEFHYDAEYDRMYDEYVNDIYNSLVFD